MGGVPEVLSRFRAAVGAGRVAGPKLVEGRQPLYRWVASSRADVTKVGSLIGPWLSRQKRAQFQSAVGLAWTAVPRASMSWAAGLFDAEGSTSLGDHRSHRGYKYVEAAITQGGAHVPEELARFMAVVGLGTVYGPYEQEDANEPIYRWRLQHADGVHRLVHLLQPWLGSVKRVQAWNALALVDGQPILPRGRVEWGSHKSHCVHGHEYASARVRPYVSRGAGIQRRDNKQCLVCSREQARARRRANKTIGGPQAADR
ncbi:MAG: hypothetical protein QOH08_2618 [Chloroflexota bacterium]|nr:hypothetical protein [Chloroflexota bacterium]